MQDQFDVSLFDSPYSQDEPPRWRRLAILIGILAVAAVTVAVAVWAGSNDSPDDLALSTSTSQPSSDSTVATTTLPTVRLTPNEPDPPLLHHPTRLPEGWEACRVIEDASRGDRFCDPQSPDDWVQVSVKYPQTVNSFDGAPTTGNVFDGKWLSVGETNEAAYLRGFTYVSVMSAALPPDTLLAIAGSIPSVSDFGALYGSYEVPLNMTDMSDEELALLLADFDNEPVVQRRTGEVQVFTPFVTLYGFWGDGFTLPDFAPTISLPRLVEAPRPLVIGESLESGRAIALWDQGGYGWRLEGRMTAENATDLTLELINQISDFPTE